MPLGLKLFIAFWLVCAVGTLVILFSEWVESKFN